jgi:hypothetical protein
MFASLTLDREPLSLAWDTFVAGLNSWAQITGGFAMVGLVLWLIAYFTSGGGRGGSNAIVRELLGSFAGMMALLLLGPLGALAIVFGLRKKALGGEPRALTTALFVGAFAWAAFGYLVLLALYLPELVNAITGNEPPSAPHWRIVLQSVLWTLAGASALFAVVLPILADLARLSPRRSWAIARLSFKEAVRRKVLWVFLALLLVVLFASWFIPNKPEDQVRTYVQVVFLAMALLMLLLAALISGFGIPDDIRHQTIHTVLTKPVQRFEIFLGRFLGYTALMTAALVVVSGLSLLYVLRNINPEARQESLKARQPHYGTLSYQGTKDREKGENVGREWDYRGYVVGKPRNSPDPTQYAVWKFDDVPRALREHPTTRLEFALDIYRTHKGVENQGIFCTFFVESWRFDADNPVMYEKYKAEKRLMEDKGERDSDARLAEKFGYYEFSSKEIQDFHTQWIEVPREVFEDAARPPGEADQARIEELRRRKEWPAKPLRVRVRVDSSGQFVGMARRDLFFRLDQEDPSGDGDRIGFCLNFFKGSVGVWLRLCLMIGLAVALSTYLSGVITLLTTGILYVLGYFQEFITTVALKKNPGGGPLESMMRLVKRPGGESAAGMLDEGTTKQVATWMDEFYSWGLRRILNLIPDVGNYNFFTDFVAEGVSIPPTQMAMSFLLLLAYLLPWAVLAYYLLKWREIAGST